MVCESDRRPNTTHWMEQIASDKVLERSYHWLCDRRRDYSHNDDVWNLRREWRELKPILQASLLAGTYKFSEVRRIWINDDQPLEVWAALDALVLKAIAIVFTEHLVPQLSERCFHLVGRGGAKAAVRETISNLKHNSFVFRTDVKSYYASIDLDVLYGQLCERIDDERLLALLRGYLRRIIYDGGRYEDVERGISLGCPLSPLMGAIYLDVLDRRMKELGLYYARFMDDWVILAPTRWKLCRAIKIVNQTLAELKVQQHPGKTFIGRICRGFDFLGYQLDADCITVAKRTRERFVTRINRLYEQGADVVRIGQYVRRWLAWFVGGPLAFLCRFTLRSFAAVVVRPPGLTTKTTLLRTSVRESPPPRR